MNFTVAEENYIKAIWHLQRYNNDVTTNLLAGQLNTRPASVTDMLKKLKTKKLVHYEKYHGFSLTSEGKKIALGIIRRHRLWEFFLAEKLHFDWDEVHDIAEDLEHVSSKKLIDKLDEYLGFPKVDPHGDPIPDNQGKMETSSAIGLHELELNKTAEVSGVGNQSSELLELLKHKNIRIGTKLEVKKRFEFDQSLEIKIRNLPAFTISEQLAKNLLVKYGK
ncbi:MAG: metal-dependent transcriptional regulator [Sphingobacteriales bacterium]|nr:MAG: metal-dependent transcriptional regulator [Sphingobacteriales bacterium]